MDIRTRRFREQILKIQSDKGTRARRYPRQLRDEILSYAEERRRQGAAKSVVARSLGLNPHTFYSWIRGGQPRDAFQRVHVAEGSTAHPVLVTPDGYRVEGLDVGGVVRLLRELA